MERVLALQSLSLSDVAPVDGRDCDSTISATCSATSMGTAGSSCSGACPESEQMDW